MTELQEMQFELLPTATSGEGVAFGIDLPVSIDDGGFDPGSNDWITQDSESPTRGNTDFGRDVLRGPLWSWSMHTNRKDVKGALASLGEIGTAWRARKVMPVPGAVTAVRYRMGGRTRRVYGRPRSFAAPPTNLILNGFVPITADFKCADELTYDDAESSIFLVPNPVTESGGGFVFPVTFPVNTLAPTASPTGGIVVYGDEPAYPVIRFEGPTSEPWLEVVGEWRVDLDAALGVNDYAVIDTRPWAISALRNGTEGVGGKIGRRQRFSKMRLAPGGHSLRFGGSGNTGGSSCTVSWRSAWNSI